jgi:hypothetical protein
MTTAPNCVEIRVKQRLVVVPAVCVNGNKVIATGKWLRTATVHGEKMMERELENPELYVNKLRNGGNAILKADIFSFSQKLPSTTPRYPYPMEFSSIAAIPFVSFKKWWESLPQETRKNVRRSQKRGVVLAVKNYDDGLVQKIREVNDDCRLVQGMPNAYYGQSFAKTKQLYGEFLGRCDFICAYFGEELVGFLHLVYRGEIASILNLTTKAQHFDKRPANALIAKAVEMCEARNISYLTYGQYRYGNKSNSSLLEFKIRNGFEELKVPQFYVPLTTKGAICIKLKLHRGLIGILPSSVISIAADLRAKWYDFLPDRAGVAQR